MKGRRGATLIEFVLTILLVGATIPPLLIAFGRMQEQNMQQMPVNVATHLARNQLERTIYGTTFANTVSAGPTPFSSPFQDYLYQVTVNYVQQSDLNTPVDPTVTDFKRVRITVTNGSMPSLTVSLITLVTNL